MTNFSLVYAYHASDTGDPWKRFAVGVPVGNDLPGLDLGWGDWIKVGAEGSWNVP